MTRVRAWVQRIDSKSLGVDSSAPQKVAVFAPLFEPAKLGGGPIRTLAALVEAQPEHTSSLVFASDRDLDRARRLDVASNETSGQGNHLRYYVSTNKIASLIRGLVRVRQYGPSILYVNGFFTPIFSILPQVLGRLRFFPSVSTIVVAPRGEFSLGALALKPTKKRFYIRVYRFFGLHHQVTWHASAEEEAADIRREFGSNTKVLVRENETRLPKVADRPATDAAGPLRVIFLSRVVKKKGLHVLLSALQSVTQEIDVTVFGTVEDKPYFDICEVLADRLPPNVSYRFGGALDPSAVRRTFTDFHLFAFPTAGENFGHVIAESLSVSCPIMCSDSTPWNDRLRAGGGVVVPGQDMVEWTAALQKYAELTGPERLERRLRAADAFDTWRSASKGKHIFELAGLGGGPDPKVPLAG
ncbi:MAG: glycosyltransferase family 4 protein [Kineosporiaceae bacterium]|nr:glycosyltransferase family 4 protein [Aeromicrobium sp.]